MKKKSFLSVCFVSIAMSMAVSSCDVLNNLIDQAASIANLYNCEYSIKDVNNLYVAGVSVQSIANGNISTSDVLKLSSAIMNKQVPISMDVNVNVKNPTTTNAALTALDWICEIDGTQFATGRTNQTYNVAPNTTSAVPLTVNADIYSLFSQGGLESLKNFVNSFSNDGTSSKVAIKIKPSLSVGGATLQSPEYITIQKNVGAKATGSTTTTTNNNNNPSTPTTPSTNNSNNNNNNNTGNNNTVNTKKPVINTLKYRSFLVKTEEGPSLRGPSSVFV